PRDYHAGGVYHALSGGTAHQPAGGPPLRAGTRGEGREPLAGRSPREYPPAARCRPSDDDQPHWERYPSPPPSPGPLDPAPTGREPRQAGGPRGVSGHHAAVCSLPCGPGAAGIPNAVKPAWPQGVVGLVVVGRVLVVASDTGRVAHRARKVKKRPRYAPCLTMG